MNSINFLQTQIIDLIEEIFGLDAEKTAGIEVKIELGGKFGDLSTNAAMVLAGRLKIAPMVIANKIKSALLADLVGEHENSLAIHVEAVEIAGPGFINISLKSAIWHTIMHELFAHPRRCFELDFEQPRQNYLVEFVSANPTGPLSIAHGRNAILGDVLCRILAFVGHGVTREFYINDAGSQIDRLAASLKARCQELIGKNINFPEDGYAGQYILDHAAEILKEYCIAKDCIEICGCGVADRPLSFFREFGAQRMLQQIKKDLENYGVKLDVWFSEQSLHDNGDVAKAIELLKEKNFIYTLDDGSIWFKSTEFGDDKDRVVQKSDGSYTYIAPDIAYHQKKFERNFDVIVNVFGQDHHSYAKRLHAAMQALGFPAQKLHFIIYQLVSMKYHGQMVRMSKRSGAFEALSDVIKNVGCDVARFFFLNKKADSHLEFDLELAQTKDLNNPVFYLQYAYVRTNSILKKAFEEPVFKQYAEKIQAGDAHFVDQLQESAEFHKFGSAEVALLKQVCQLKDLLTTIVHNFQTHLLAAYAHELASSFHSYYNANRIVDPANVELSQTRLLMVQIVRNTLELCFDLMGISKPDKM